ncbi:MAG: LamG-like jellyroll fold domain-containing protein [Planctomycetota bacterium]|jgi:hypothetical protein
MCRKLIYLNSFILILGLVLPSVSDAANPNLVGYWRFDGNLNDSSGNEHHGTPSGNPQFVTGVYNEALELDGDDYVTIEGYKGVLGTNAFSISAWVNCTGSGSSQIVAWGSQGSGTEANFLIRAQNNRLQLSTWAGNARTNNNSVSTGQWYHVVVTVEDNVGGTDNARLYIDGQDATNVSGINSLNIVGDEDVGIGWNPTRQGGYFIGLIDDLAIYDKVLTPEEVVKNMNGEILTSSAPASNPSPTDGLTDVPRDVVLSWTPGEYVTGLSPKHKVFFSENFDNVNDGIGGITQDPNTYTPPGILEFSKTYYWRIDEANSVSGWDQGNIWQFTVEPIAYAIAGEDITATASSQDNENVGPENTVNGSGLDNTGLLHGKEVDGNMWLSGNVPAQSTWIQYEFSKIFKLHQMWVWNFNGSYIAYFGIKNATIEYSTDGTNWTELDGVPEFEKAPAVDDYVHDTIVDFGGVAARYVRINSKSNWSEGITDQCGLSEVRFFYIPVRARRPNPDSGATDVNLDLNLSWVAGREAATHDVYFSASKKAVLNGTAPVTSMTETSYGPLSLDLGETYYWRVDEVNEAGTRAMWEGDVWDFSTYEFFVVDDFEVYDANENEIWSIWHDGLGYWDQDLVFHPGNETGSGVGDEDTDSYMEEGIVNNGAQSMPFFYNNSGSTGKAFYSEAKLTLDSARDWTRKGVKALSLWFRGYPVSVGSFTDNLDGTYTMTGSGTDIWDVGPSDGPFHDEFHFAWKQFSGTGSIIAKVESVQNTHNWAKAGVMIRDTLDPNSVHAMIIISPAQGVSYQRRALAGDSSSSTTDAGFAAPLWVKIERDLGGNITASYSVDGSTWTQLGGDVVPLNTPMYIGLALTSHDVNLTCEAVFSDVQITGAISPDWTNQDIGILSNDLEPMYVALANNTGEPAVVPHDDPNAVRIDTWTEWNIDIQEFANQGVNLADVNSIAIGFGTRGNTTTPGGSGKMYFDDIRLYAPRCLPSLLKPVADFSNNCLVDLADLEIMADNWLISGYDVMSVAVSDANLILHYEFEGNANDSSGNGNHGDPNGGVSYTAGKIGQAISLDGVNDYVAIQNLNYASTGYTGWTVCAWIRTSSSLMQTIASLDRSEYWRLELGESTYAGAGEVGWEVDTITGQVDAISTTLVDDGKWHHVVGVFDNGQLIIYIDGKIETLSYGGSTSGSGTIRYGFIGSQSEATVFDGDRSATPGHFDGDLDDIRIYERALSQAEIVNLTGVPVGETLYQPLQRLLSVADDIDLHDDEKVNFTDFAVLADSWLDEQLWPQP